MLVLTHTRAGLCFGGLETQEVFGVGFEGDSLVGVKRGQVFEVAGIGDALVACARCSGCAR